MKLIPSAGALCGVALLFYFIYTQSYDGASIVVLLVFFAYFLNLKSATRGGASPPSPASGQVVSLPRELAKGLGCLVAAGVLAIGAGYSIPDSRLALSIGLTAVVVGVVAFVLFVLRALNVRRSE